MTPANTGPGAVINRLRYRLGYSPSVIMKLNEKYFYPFVTHGLGADEMLFLSVGYEEDPPMALPLAASDEPDRFCIHLYHRTATQVDLSGKRVLEVSCGHGGGASYLVRTLCPASYTGLDLNPAGIEFCRKRHNLPGQDFVHGNAENLPFADQSFDAVLNVEASHLYSRFPRFLTEVERVLRPGGHFLYTDFRPRHRLAKWEAELADAPMRLISERVIDAQIVRGMEQKRQQSQELSSRHPPAFLARLVRNYLEVWTDSRFSRYLQRGAFSYRMYCFAKD
jgi:ubiquinone/menaquinone biosynthesis C-methylase UbiE